MIFTVLSIFISIFEYLLSTKIIAEETVMIVSFEVESTTISKMDKKPFKQQIILRETKLLNCMAKICSLEPERIERLIPIQQGKGALFKFIINCGLSKFSKISNSISDSIINDNLSNQISIIYDLKQPTTKSTQKEMYVHIPKDSLKIEKVCVRPDENEFDSDDGIALVQIQSKSITASHSASHSISQNTPNVSPNSKQAMGSNDNNTHPN